MICTTHHVFSGFNLFSDIMINMFRSCYGKHPESKQYFKRFIIDAYFYTNYFIHRAEIRNMAEEIYIHLIVALQQGNNSQWWQVVSSKMKHVPSKIKFFSPKSFRNMRFGHISCLSDPLYKDFEEKKSWSSVEVYVGIKHKYDFVTHLLWLVYYQPTSTILCILLIIYRL